MNLENRILWLSRILQVLTVLAALTTLAGTFAVLFVPNYTLVLQSDSGLWMREAQELPWIDRWAAAAIGGIPNMFWLFGLYQIFALCRVLRRHEIFSIATFGRLHRFGIALAGIGLSEVVVLPLATWYFTSRGHLQYSGLALGVDDLFDSLDLVLAGLLMVLVATVMRLAVELSEDQKYTV